MEFGPADKFMGFEINKLGGESFELRLSAIGFVEKMVESFEVNSSKHEVLPIGSRVY